MTVFFTCPERSDVEVARFSLTGCGGLSAPERGYRVLAGGAGSVLRDAAPPG